MCLVAVAAGAMAKAVERMALTLAKDEENTRMRLNPRGMPSEFDEDGARLQQARRPIFLAI